MSETLKINKIEKVKLLDEEEVLLPNGLPLYFLEAGDQPVMRIEIVFDAGTSCYPNRVLPSATAALLNDGTSRHSASQLADIIDGKGAYFFASSGADATRVYFFTLTRFAEDLIPRLLEMVNDSVFPDKEVELYRDRMKQQFLIQRQRVNVRSHQEMLNALFGRDGAYGDPTVEEDFDKLSREDIRRFYRDGLKNKPSFVVISGKIGKSVKDFLIRTFGRWQTKKSSLSRLPFMGTVSPPGKPIEIPAEDTSQVSLRLARIAPHYTDPGYWEVSLLSTLLGGYFGSRLNKVLREEKGLTYGVHSSLTLQKECTFFAIHSELNRENRVEAYSAMLGVFEELKSKEIEREELNMVVQYIKGNLLQDMDGPFEQSNQLAVAKILGMERERVHHFFDFLDQVTPGQIRQTAQNFLDETSFYKVVAGV